MGAQPDEGVGDVRLDVATLEVEEEHVAPEALLARPRLDPGEVYVARGELGQAVDELGNGRKMERTG